MSEREIDPVEMGRRIAARRKQMGMTQEELAEKGDMTTQFVSYAELGKRAMRAENLWKVASALEVSADYLLTGDVVDIDRLILSEKLRELSPPQLRFISDTVDACKRMFGEIQSTESAKTPLDRVADLRMDRDLTQQQIADLLHCTQETYRRYENGTRELPLSYAVTLAKYYRVSLDYLAGLTDRRYPPD